MANSPASHVVIYSWLSARLVEMSQNKLKQIKSSLGNFQHKYFVELQLLCDGENVSCCCVAMWKAAFLKFSHVYSLCYLLGYSTLSFCNWSVAMSKAFLLTLVSLDNVSLHSSYFQLFLIILILAILRLVSRLTGTICTKQWLP